MALTQPLDSYSGQPCSMIINCPVSFALNFYFRGFYFCLHLINDYVFKKLNNSYQQSSTFACPWVGNCPYPGSTSSNLPRRGHRVGREGSQEGRIRCRVSGWKISSCFHPCCRCRPFIFWICVRIVLNKLPPLTCPRACRHVIGHETCFRHHPSSAPKDQ